MARLSAKEIAIIAGLADGLQSKEIAAVVRLSKASVDTYIRILYGKLDARSRAARCGSVCRGHPVPPRNRRHRPALRGSVHRADGRERITLAAKPQTQRRVCGEAAYLTGGLRAKPHTQRLVAAKPHAQRLARSRIHNGLRAAALHNGLRAA